MSGGTSSRGRHSGHAGNDEVSCLARLLRPWRLFPTQRRRRCALSRRGRRRLAVDLCRSRRCRARRRQLQPRIVLRGGQLRRPQLLGTVRRGCCTRGLGERNAHQRRWEAMAGSSWRRLRHERFELNEGGHDADCSRIRSNAPKRALAEIGFGRSRAYKLDVGCRNAG